MTELVDVLESQYLAQLAQSAAKWQVRHPEEAKAIRGQIAAEFKIAGQSAPEPDSLRWQIFEAAVNEAIRAKNGWRTVRQWMLDPANNPPVAPTFVPPALKPVAVDREDRQKLAAGDR